MLGKAFLHAFFITYFRYLFRLTEFAYVLHLSFCILSERTISPEDGSMPNIIAIGLICLFSVVITANINIFIISNTISLLLVLTVFISILLFPFIWYLQSASDEYDIYGSYQHIMGKKAVFFEMLLV